MNDFDKDSMMVRDLYLADEKRNTRVQKYCEYCNVPVIVEQTEKHPLCDDHKGAAL